MPSGAVAGLAITAEAVGVDGAPFFTHAPGQRSTSTAHTMIVLRIAAIVAPWTRVAAAASSWPFACPQAQTRGRDVRPCVTQRSRRRCASAPALAASRRFRNGEREVSEARALLAREEATLWRLTQLRG